MVLSLFGRRDQPALTITVEPGSEPRFEGDSSLREEAVEFGSITKAVTGLVLADLDRTGLLPLETPVHEVLELAKPLLADDTPVTIEDLATHHSGLPRLGDMNVADRSDPYRDEDRASVMASLEARLDRPGRRRFQYSNFGFAVLGLCIESVAGTWQQAVSTRVLEPLAIDEVWAGPPPDSVTTATGRSRWGRPVPWWNMGAYQAAGAVTGTGDGMAELMTALTSNDPTAGQADVRQLLEAATTPRRDVPGGRIGLAWHVAKTGHRWHNGATGGFSSFLILDPAMRRAVARLAVGPPNPRAERQAAELIR